MACSKTSGGFTSNFTVKDSSAYDLKWKIKPYSKFQACNESKQTSGRFEAKGYSWKLVVYLNGNIVDGQISFYLMLSRATSHPTETVFQVSYQLFLFDQKAGSILSQKGENCVRVQEEMGFQNFIDLKTFKDSSNGYLLNGSCLFGVKIHRVVPIQTNTECLTNDFTVKNSSAYDLEWKINPFSKLPAGNESKQTSGRFEAKGYSWKLVLYPKGNNVKGQISLYLMLSRATSHPTETVFEVSYELFLIDQKVGRTWSQKGENCVRVQEEMGFENFIDLKIFKDSSNGYLLNGSCLFGVKIHRVVPIQTNTECLTNDFTVKDSSTYDFRWIINPFSKLPAGNESKQTSGRFEAKGYSWKLVLYPKGNNVKGQISLYLMLSRATSHPTETVFDVSYELFLIDQKVGSPFSRKGNHTSVEKLFDQKVGSTFSRKGEHRMEIQDEVGFRNLIDLKTFNHSSNGYLLNERCSFGVNIYQVVPIQGKIEYHQPLGKKISNKYKWKIENFSKIDKKESLEKKFTVGDYLWSIVIHPEGSHKRDIKVKGKNVSLYLCYNGSIYDGPFTKVYADYSLTIIDQIGGNHEKMTATEVFKSSPPGWGKEDFLPHDDFYDPKQGFIVNDTCIIEATVSVSALVK